MNRLVGRVRLLAPYFLAVLSLSVALITEGRGADLLGVYASASGMASLDLSSGGKATLTMLSERYECWFKEKESGKKVLVDCAPRGGPIEFLVNSDGSLTGPGFMGLLRKSK